MKLILNQSQPFYDFGGNWRSCRKKTDTCAIQFILESYITPKEFAIIGLGRTDYDTLKIITWRDK
jgi:hypothetical protein